MTHVRKHLPLAASLLFGIALSVWCWGHPLPRTFVLGASTYEVVSPRALAWLGVVPFVIVTALQSLDHASLFRRILSVFTRLVFLAALIVAIARPSRVVVSDNVFAVYLVDVSDSIPDDALKDASRVVKDAFATKRSGDEIRVVAFARHPRMIDVDPSKGDIAWRSEVAADAPHDLSEGSATDIASAVRLARGLYPPGFVKRLALLSDGVQTSGDLLGETDEIGREGIRLFSPRYTREVPGEVAVEAVHLRDPIQEGETFDVHIDVFSTRETRATLTLHQGEILNPEGGVKSLTLHPGNNDVVMKSQVKDPGEVTYTAEISQVADDRFSENNIAKATATVVGPPRVLYIEGARPRPQYISSALQAQKFEVHSAAPDELPTAAGELDRYDFVILSDVALDEVSPSTERALEAYVRDVGGGLLVAGGERGLALAGGAHPTVAALLPVTIPTEATQEEPDVAISLVIDRSGSMTGNPLEMAKAAARATAETLAPEDTIEVIAFDSTPLRVVPLTAAKHRGRIQADIARIQAGGGTEIYPALDAAYQSLNAARAKRKHVILLTDGEAPTNGIRELVTRMGAEGITVTAIGLGTSIDQTLLRMIADVGGGRFYAVSDPNSLPRVFTRETEVVSRKVAVEKYVQPHVRSRAQMLHGVDVESSPPLHGYVATEMKPAPAELVLSVGERDEPLLARWHLGLGWSLVWTSDLKSMWATEWVQWPGFTPFFGQLVREHMRTRHKQELPMQASLDPASDRISAVVDAIGSDDEFIDGLAGRLHVDPPGKVGAFDLPMRHSAPGRYEVSFPGAGMGSYRLRANLGPPADAGVGSPAFGTIETFGHVEHAYPREYSVLTPNNALLERAALGTGGKITDSARDVLSAGSDHVQAHEELWMRALALALLLLVLDVAVRKLPAFWPLRA